MAGSCGCENDKSNGRPTSRRFASNLVVLIFPMHIGVSAFVVGSVSKRKRKKITWDDVDDTKEVNQVFLKYDAHRGIAICGLALRQVVHQ